MSTSGNLSIDAVSPRMSWTTFEKSVPGAVAALRSLGQAVHDTGLDKRLIELVKVRVSQLNGCAYCLKLHLDWARQAGVPQMRLDLVAAWRDAGCFDTRERAALAWAESLTCMMSQHVDDEAFEHARRQFSETELAALTTAVATINAWNRIAGSLRFAMPG
ncbi:carboxymuconolactone decarboxylase family protein [Paraburkholderia adhaesiva]|uniref:carboxymuconolactone decarboxylase family protein n=1 Tax=Paraburkholderia adhaesiva TaxID=2883244 RepID=UPI001F300E6E|nr:carboxymuconolactone decarboxylase family protein [Paraburkholderia adhaesiva]